MKGTTETITLKAVLDHLDSGAPCSLAIVTDDQNRGTGGEWIEIPEARKHNWLSKKEKAQLAKAQPKSEIIKDPNHYENATRNIILPNGEVRKIAIRLIRRFSLPGVINLFENGKTVM